MMDRRPTIAVLTHAADNFNERRSIVRLMIPRWHECGIRVVVVTDAQPFVQADIALLHVDLSVVPESCRRLAERYPRVINGAALDIRKRIFSQLRVDREGADPGPVIVKTDWNFGGAPEFRVRFMRSATGKLLKRVGAAGFVCRALMRIESRRPWKSRRLIPTREYKVFARRALVPEGVWENPNLIVERFAAERDGDDYCCRHWLFFGSKEVFRRTRSRAPTVKAAARLEPLSEPVPDAIRELRLRLGFDYGKFDYGIVNGEPVLYDANRTPGALRDPIRHADTVNVLSEGIFEFIAHAVYTPANDRCMSDLAKIGNLNPKAEVARGCDASSQ